MCNEWESPSEKFGSCERLTHMGKPRQYILNSVMSELQERDYKWRPKTVQLNRGTEWLEGELCEKVEGWLTKLMITCWSILNVQ